MSDEEHTLLLVRGTIAGMPDADRKEVELAALKLREVVKTHGDHGVMAFALVGAELQMEG